MDFAFTEDQLAIKENVARLCAQFDDKYWLKKDKEGGFPNDFYKAMADAGWLGIAMPEEYGGSGLGITEAALLMQTVAESGAALQGASAVHLNIFGPNPIVVFGTEEQKKRILPDIIKGKVKGCFAVTEPDAGLNTTMLDTKAERYAEAVANPGRGGATRHTPSERLGGPVPGRRAHLHLEGRRNPRRPGGRALEREWESAAWAEARGEAG